VAIIFVNERAARVPRGATTLDAVLAADADLGGRLQRHEAKVTDARGLPVLLDAPIHDGAILRVSGSARQATGEGDALA
jgi:hypothetical protein